MQGSLQLLPFTDEHLDKSSPPRWPSTHASRACPHYLTASTHVRVPTGIQSVINLTGTYWAVRQARFYNAREVKVSPVKICAP